MLLVRSMKKIIAVASGQSGVGKTSVALNLAISLAKKGEKVCLLDADSGLSNTSMMLNLQPRFTLYHLLYADRGISEVIIKGPEGIGIIPGGNGISELTRIHAEPYSALADKCPGLDKYDYLIVDTSAGITRENIAFIRSADSVAVIFTPLPASITDGFAIMKILSRAKFKGDIFVLPNMFKSMKNAATTIDKVSGVCREFLGRRIESLHPIIFDSQVTESVIRQQPFANELPDSPASVCLAKIADQVIAWPHEKQRNRVGHYFMDVTRYASNQALTRLIEKHLQRKADKEREKKRKQLEKEKKLQVTEDKNRGAENNVLTQEIVQKESLPEIEPPASYEPPQPPAMPPEKEVVKPYVAEELSADPDLIVHAIKPDNDDADDLCAKPLRKQERAAKAENISEKDKNLPSRSTGEALAAATLHESEVILELINSQKIIANLLGNVVSRLDQFSTSIEEIRQTSKNSSDAINAYKGEDQSAPDDIESIPSATAQALEPEHEKAPAPETPEPVITSPANNEPQQGALNKQTISGETAGNPAAPAYDLATEDDYETVELPADDAFLQMEINADGEFMIVEKGAGSYANEEAGERHYTNDFDYDDDDEEEEWEEAEKAEPDKKPKKGIFAFFMRMFA